MRKWWAFSVVVLVCLILGCQVVLLGSLSGIDEALPALLTMCLVLILGGVLLVNRRCEVCALPDDEKELLWPVFKKVVENMPIMFDAVDENGVVLFWNKECERVTGYSSDEVVGNPNTLELFYPDPVQRAKNIEEFLEFNGAHRDWEVDLLCKDGESRTISWSNTSADAPIPGWYTWGIGVDVTTRKKAEKRLMDLAIRDDLTGLFNRRRILEILKAEIDRAVRYSDPLTLCLVDIDHFKTVNDIYGHNAGDLVLKRFAETIRAEIRKTDSVGRYGGEEFCIVLPHTAAPEARVLLERIRETISARPFLLDSGVEITISISLGLVQYSPLIKDFQEAISLADKALYRAKSLGRNRLCVA